MTGGSPVNLTLLITSYQNAYSNLYASTTDVYEAQYATDIETLLPSTTPLGELEAQGKLPAAALFSSTPPDPAYAAMTPATTPSNLAPVFATGFGTDHLLTNDFAARLSTGCKRQSGWWISHAVGWIAARQSLAPVAPGAEDE